MCYAFVEKIRKCYKPWKDKELRGLISKCARASNVSRIWPMHGCREDEEWLVFDGLAAIFFVMLFWKTSYFLRLIFFGNCAETILCSTLDRISMLIHEKINI